MDERDQQRKIRHRLAVLRHTEELSEHDAADQVLIGRVDGIDTCLGRVECKTDNLDVKIVSVEFGMVRLESKTYRILERGLFRAGQSKPG